MALNIDIFREEFVARTIHFGEDWAVKCFIAPDGTLYPFGTDTKVISTVFESLSASIIADIAKEYGYVVEGAEQTIYPDFTLSTPPGRPPRIAIDIKTTYRKFNKNGSLKKFVYTLGSYTSYLRTPGATKNITYPYNKYSDHWVIGFLYTRREGVLSKVYNTDTATEDIQCPYQDVDFFVQEKYKIVGCRPGSGDTTNIGSFPANSIQELKDGHGPFEKYGKEICDEYWRNFEPSAAKRQYNNIEEFLEWRKNLPRR